MSSAVNRTSVTPAGLSFLAIYNPSLSNNDESLQEQIVYYYSDKEKGPRRREPSGDASTEQSQEDLNERLRQIGLAQGMIEFAKDFSNGEAVEAIETEKSRIVLHELEPGWWILASIALTRISSAPEKSSNNPTSSNTESTTEYSAREVSPPALLLQQLLRAHQIFLLHHGPNLHKLYSRLVRVKFCRFLRHFWDEFIWGWDVLLHGNPAVDLFNGLKLAAGGELGIGVGEEDWGSGEREVLEGFIGRTEGLVDLIVSRFGDAPQGGPIPQRDPASDQFPISEWQGNCRRPRPSDGVIFSGIGAITRSAVKAISSWVELLYKDGQEAYGIRDNPSAPRRRKRNKQSHPQSLERKPKKILNPHSTGSDLTSILRNEPKPPTGIPAPIVGPTRAQLTTVKNSGSSRGGTGLRNTTGASPMATVEDRSSGTDTLMKYLTLGVYGSRWRIKPMVHRRVSDLRGENIDTVGAGSRQANHLSAFPQEQKLSHGYFMIGLQGELDQDAIIEDSDHDTEPGTDQESVLEDQSWSQRTMLRTLYVERAKGSPAGSSGSMRTSSVGDDPSMDYFDDRLRVVVYVQQPFIFTFLFELQTDSLAIPSFYHSLHHQLGPLQRPLLTSTSPQKVSERLWEAAAPKSTSATASSQPICDFVYDPANLTVHTTIPNIPESAAAVSREAAAASTDPTVTPAWSRVEALSVHSQILNTYASTRRNTTELERTSKTSRGWWVVWMRLPYNNNGTSVAAQQRQTHSNSSITSNPYREAYLVRKATDYTSSPRTRKSGLFGVGRDRDKDKDKDGASSGGGSAGWMNPGRLAEGIGIDARQYIESLLSLNR